ncbi:MAG: hypothetical protein WCA46_16975, partial [Actinocatenispora sp.]
MQPFEKHTADVGSLESCGAGLLKNAGGAVDNADATRRAYSPAIASWNGMCAPELQAAGLPIQASAQASNAALAWAAVVTRYWAAKIKSFNKRVDHIVAGLHAAAGSDGHYGATGTEGKPPTAGQIHAAKVKAVGHAKAEWWKAYHEDIVDGGTRVSSMLTQGPTKNNVAAAKHSGALDGPDWNPVSRWLDGFKGLVVPPFQPGFLGDLALGGWGAGQLNFAGSQALNWLNTVTLGNYTQGHWRTTPSGGRVWIEPYWKANPDQAAARNSLLRGSKWLGRGGTVLSVGTGALDQWMSDSDRDDLDTTAKVGRAATR